MQPDPKIVAELAAAQRDGQLVVPLCVLVRDLPRQLVASHCLARSARENADEFFALGMVPPPHAAGELEYRIALLEDRWRAERQLSECEAALDLLTVDVSDLQAPGGLWGR